MSAAKYSAVTAEVIEELKAIVGERYVLTDEDTLETCSHDEVAEKRYAHLPEVAVRPGSADEVAAIMRLANRLLIPVTPRGAGSGLSGGAVPLFGGIALMTDRLNRVIEIDPQNMTITLEPGVVTKDISDMIKGYGLFYAGYPMSLETCYIGGNVAENAGGGKAVKYGVTGRYVIGLEVVTPTGRIVRMGGKRVKDVTGYNLIGLMVGSEGTLGIFTEITLKLVPLPKAQVDLFCLFKTPADAIRAVPEIMTSTGITPTAIEFMERAALDAACDFLNEELPLGDAGAALLVTLDGADEESLEREYFAVGEIIEGLGALEIYVADNHTTSERMWRVRRNLPEAMRARSPELSTEDIVVPIAAIPQVVAACHELAERYGTEIISYGHAGDGNLHAKVTKSPNWSDQEWQEQLPKLLRELYQITASLGGTISGEHGIGHKRKKYMSLVVDEGYMEMMRAVKRALDPNNVLNPGKIFDL